MSVDQGLVDWVEECLSPVGALTLRRMMGGATLYLNGTVFAIIADDQLWFKADKLSDATWDEAGCPPFRYAFKDGREGRMNYRRAPEDVHDDPDAMRHWAAIALEAGQRAPVKKPKSMKRQPAKEGQD